MPSLVLKSRCQYANFTKPCVASINKTWTRAPFICLLNQTTNAKNQESSESLYSGPTYSGKVFILKNFVYKKNISDDTIIFFDSNACLIARTQTHQYTFCFRRQSCQQSKTAAFCTTKTDAERICKQEKDGSDLLTIENDDEYQLISDIISRYANETVLNQNGLLTHKLNKPATWMWIDGQKG